MRGLGPERWGIDFMRLGTVLKRPQVFDTDVASQVNAIGSVLEHEV